MKTPFNPRSSHMDPHNSSTRQLSSSSGQQDRNRYFIQYNAQISRTCSAGPQNKCSHILYNIYQHCVIFYMKVFFPLHQCIFTRRYVYCHASSSPKAYFRDDSIDMKSKTHTVNHFIHIHDIVHLINELSPQFVHCMQKDEQFKSYSSSSEHSTVLS